MKPIVIMRHGQCSDEKRVAKMIEDAGYLVVFTHAPDALTMLDPNQYDVKETEQYVTIDATGPKAGTPCS